MFAEEAFGLHWMNQTAILNMPVIGLAHLFGEKWEI